MANTNNNSMNYLKQSPNGPLTVADQAKFLQINSGTRLIGAPDRLRDKLAAALATYNRTDAGLDNEQRNRIALLHKGFSILTANNCRQKKNHRN